MNFFFFSICCELSKLIFSYVINSKTRYFLFGCFFYHVSKDSKCTKCFSLFIQKINPRVLAEVVKKKIEHNKNMRYSKETSYRDLNRLVVVVWLLRSN